MIRFDMSSAENPLKDQTTLSTGMSMFGRMSVGVRDSVSGPTNKMSNATTTNV